MHKLLQVFCNTILLIITTVGTFTIGTYMTIAAEIDTIPPHTSYSLTPSTANGNNGWYTTPVQVQLEASDLDSGVAEINYQIDEQPWKKVEFTDTLNLVTNASFETPGSNNCEVYGWSFNGFASCISTKIAAPGFEESSLQLSSDDSIWHGITNRDTFAVTTFNQNLTASIWIKTQDVQNQAFFKVFALAMDQNGQETTIELIQSSKLSGTTDWTRLSTTFGTALQNIIGVYIDIGFEGSGTIWVDAVCISSSVNDTNTNFLVNSDSNNHQIKFYSVDRAGNGEPIQQLTFKIDQTKPGNWHDVTFSDQGNAHQFVISASVEDATSGLSQSTNKYQYKPYKKNDYGYFEDLDKCNSTWHSNEWLELNQAVGQPGVHSATLITPKTNFCEGSTQSRTYCALFYAEDVAGNSTQFYQCLYGPWIKSTQNGFVRSNSTISMLSEAPEYNTDSLIEIGATNIDAFTSDLGWNLTNSPTPIKHNYDNFWNITGNKTKIINGILNVNSGIYNVTGDFTINSESLPNGFNTSVFDQIVFIDGDLTIATNILLNKQSTMLFIVSGNTKIDKNVTHIECAIYTDNTFYTAYNVTGNDTLESLYLKGTYKAEKVELQRGPYIETNSGIGNSPLASEQFEYNPAYIIKFKRFFNTNTVKWTL